MSDERYLRPRGNLMRRIAELYAQLDAADRSKGPIELTPAQRAELKQRIAVLTELLDGRASDGKPRH